MTFSADRFERRGRPVKGMGAAVLGLQAELRPSRRVGLVRVASRRGMRDRKGKGYPVTDHALHKAALAKHGELMNTKRYYWIKTSRPQVLRIHVRIRIGVPTNPN